MSERNLNYPSFFGMWREWIVRSEQQWSESMSKLLKDEATAGVLSRQLDEARMMQKMFAEMMQSYLATVNLPSRLDLQWLDERMGRVEDGLGAVQAQLVQLRDAVVKARRATPDDAGVIWLPRTRRAPTERPR